MSILACVCDDLPAGSVHHEHCPSYVSPEQMVIMHKIAQIRRTLTPIKFDNHFVGDAIEGLLEIVDQLSSAHYHHDHNIVIDDKVRLHRTSGPARR